jgi:hypothetical protein
VTALVRSTLAAWGLWLLTATAAADGLEHLESTEDWDSLLLLTPPEGASEGTIESAPAADEAKEPEKKKRSRRARKDKKKAETSAYARMRDSWHTAVVEDGSWADAGDGSTSLTMKGVGRDEPVVITPEGEHGGFDAGDITFASMALGGWDGGPEVHPRLLDLIYQAARHFHVGTVNVVSGIRKDRQGSRHSHGLAADIVLPGVDDEELAAFFREQGFVGVGTYPKGGFVHIDVREQSYFWIDKSAPGSRRSRVHQVRAEEARAMDEAARARGVEPHDNPVKLKKVLHARAKRRNEKGAAKRKHAARPAAAESAPAQPPPPSK